MLTNEKSLKAYLERQEFPLASQYDPQWIIENQMGPNPILLTEWLCQAMDLKPGMRVLDLGCGKGLSSIFMAKEYGVQVWATDLWIGATENRLRIEQAGFSDQIFPIHAEAKVLPFAESFFDAILCVDSYIYFGTDDLYLDYIHKYLKPEGRIGMIVPGFMQDLNGPLPQHLHPFWAQECWTWHTVDWWKNHWSRTGLVLVETADRLPDGCQIWLDWEKGRYFAGNQHESVQSDIQVLEADGGQYMGFIRMTAVRS